MNKNLLFSVLALTAFAFADGDTTNSPALANEDLIADNCNPKPECKPTPPPCKPKPKPVCKPCVRKAMQPIVLTSSRPCNDVGIYIFADALYWHADVGNSDWAFVNNGTTPGVPTGSNVNNTFSWDWGFRAGIGFDLDHDQWDTDIYYTWFRATSNSGDGDHDSDDNGVSVSAPAFANTLADNYASTFTAGSASSKLHFNVLDWELGRWFYISNSVSLRPHVGLKGSWITLTTSESLTGGLPISVAGTSAYTVSNSTKSWSVGPSGGINTNWYFGTGNTHDMRDGHRNEVRSRPHFSIFGDFAGALMFSHFKNSHSETGTSATGATVSGFNPTNLNRNQVVPVLQSIVGLAFDTCFSCDKMHLAIRVGYEFQWWFRENQRLYVDSRSTTSPRYVRNADDLALQGLTIDVRFDF